MDEHGFSLIEVLVVVLIIGILAAIALPTFLGESEKTRDATAKADVRNAVSQMESCFRNAEMYTNCPDARHPLAAGTAVTVTGSGASYFVTRTSTTGTIFVIARRTGGYSRTCTAPGSGGCGADSSW